MAEPCFCTNTLPSFWRRHLGWRRQIGLNPISAQISSPSYWKRHLGWGKKWLNHHFCTYSLPLILVKAFELKKKMIAPLFVHKCLPPNFGEGILGWGKNSLAPVSAQVSFPSFWRRHLGWRRKLGWVPISAKKSPLSFWRRYLGLRTKWLKKKVEPPFLHNYLPLILEKKFGLKKKMAEPLFLHKYCPSSFGEDILAENILI